MEFHPAFGHAGFGFRHSGIFQEPLFAQARFDGHIGALAETHVVLVGFFLHEHALFFENFNRHFACLKAIQPI